MNVSGFDLFVWAATFLGHLLLLFVLWKRRRAAEFPVFTTLIATDVAKTIALYFVLHHLSKGTYFYSYWSMAVLDEALQFLLFYEIAVHVFCPLSVWANEVRKMFIGMVCGSALIALLLTLLASPVTQKRIQAVVIRGNFFCAVLISQLFLGMVILSARSGLPWKTHVARIAQGLGVYSLVSVVTGAAATYFGVAHDTHTFYVLARFRILTYFVCTCFWVVMLWNEAPAPRELPEVMRTQIYTLQKQLEYDLIRLRSWRRS